MNDNNAATNGTPSLKDRVRELQLTDRLDNAGSTNAKSGNTWLPWALCIVLALTWAGVGIRSYRQKNTAPPPIDAPAKSGESGGRSADKQEVARGELVLESKGYLIPSHSISVSPIDVAGRVTVLNIQEGKSFKEGDVLAVIDSTRFLADKRETEAQVEAARSRLQELQTSTTIEIQQSEFELAEAKAQREEALVVYETTKATLSGAVARLEISQAQRKFEASSERVKALEAKLNIISGKPRDQKIEAAKRDLDAAEARLSRAQFVFDNCSIKSPVTGIILTKKAEVGSLINPVVGGVSTSLCEIADLSEIEVDLEIQERDIAKLRDDMVCRVRSDAYPERVYEGYLDRTMPIANRARGIIPVRVKVILPPNEKQGEYLKPEMGVSVSFINEQFPHSKKALVESWRGVQDGAVLPAK